MENTKNEYDNPVIDFQESSFRAEKEYTVTNHPKLYFPTADNIKEWIAEAISRKDYCVQFFGSREIWSVVDRIVMGAYKGDGRQIHIKHLADSVTEVAEIWEQLNHLIGIGTTNKDHYEHKGVLFVGGGCDFLWERENSDTLIGVGELLEDFEDGDPDPYQTAGGYRGWRALKGTSVEYHLNRDLTMRLVFDSNCEIDHYNNNYCGNSTGGGTTKYKVGERVAKRSVTLGREAMDKSWKKAKIDAKILKLDYGRLTRLISEYQPALVLARFNKLNPVKECAHEQTYVSVAHYESGEALIKCKKCNETV